jgi:ABC-2 type transport system permease protein
VGGPRRDPALRGVAAWLDQTRTMAAILRADADRDHWAHVGTSLALWLVPIALGAWRVARSDVR